MNPTAVRILYTNYKGETAWRVVLPHYVRFGSTAHHPDMQWLLEAFDVEKDAWRTFALKDVKQWVPADGQNPGEGK